MEPVLRAYAPDLIIISAGFDAVEGDPLGGCLLSPEVYGHMTRRLMAFAGGACHPLSIELAAQRCGRAPGGADNRGAAPAAQLSGG